MSVNAEICDLFMHTAQVMELLGANRFKAIAYERAARVLEELPDDVKLLADDKSKLTAIDGIGSGLADKIIEYCSTGRIAEIDALLAEVPHGVTAMLRLQGIGPKTVKQLWQDGGVESLDDLRKKIDDGSLKGLKGMGDKKLQNLRKAIDMVELAGKRIALGRAMPLAAWIIDQLTKDKKIKKIAYAGSLRRGRETIGDIDLLVAADEKDAVAISDAFVRLSPVKEVLAKGATKTSVLTSDGVQIDLRVIEPASYGAALLYFTGSKEHNVRLRERAQKMGLRLNEYGLWAEDNGKAGQLKTGETEEDIYKALGLDWIPPELREDRGEIALAEKHNLPELLRLSDIRAELHAHTTASDGKMSIAELAQAAIDRNFHTLAVTDHSKSQVIANGLSSRRLEQHISDVREVAKQFKGRINILAGSEVDILANGNLDYSDDLLAELDIVVASPHAALSQDPDTCTKRMLKAIENPYVTILGHPTGRLVLRREGLSPDMKALVQACRDRGIAMEINANHHRLDLRDTHARAALEAGVKLSVNCDTHTRADMDQLIYGILTARRAGATKDDIINCLPADALKKWIKAARA